MGGYSKEEEEEAGVAAAAKEDLLPLSTDVRSKAVFDNTDRRSKISCCCCVCGCRCLFVLDLS